jgi:Tfp pilus assembly pilus retraction ATPase PilT
MKLHSESGAVSLDEALVLMVRKRKITRDAAMQKTSDPKHLTKLLSL